jgi:hypothetical protein
MPIDTKVRAMGAKLLGAGDYTVLCNAAVIKKDTGYNDDVRRVLLWLQEKPLRDFVHLFMSVPGISRDIPLYLTLWKKLHSLDKNNRNALLPVLGMEIDLRNIVWAYRLKTYYNVQGNNLFGRLIPLRYRLNEAITCEIANAKTGKDLLVVLAKSPYTAIFPNFTHMEQKINHALAMQYKKQARLHPHTLAGVCRYLFAKQMELRNIQTIEEGLRNGLAPVEIQKHLVMAW